MKGVARDRQLWRCGLFVFSLTASGLMQIHSRLTFCEALRGLRSGLVPRSLASIGGPSAQTNEQLVAGCLPFTPFPLVKNGAQRV